MHAVTISEPGGPEVLGWGEVPDPVCGPGEVIVDVAATAVNRADLLQRQGFYPPPPGASDILGLECSGLTSEVRDGGAGWSVGDEVRALLDGAGVDVVLDNMGAKYLAPNVRSLATGGRLVSIGMQGGTKGELDLGLLMRKRAAVHATTLRSRPATGPGGKAEIVAAVRHDVWPDVERGVIRPIVDRRLPMSRAAEAHRVVEASEHIGKVLLVPED